MKVTQTQAKATGPLAGIKVVDITTVVLGPYASQVLGDMGADVIKVETTAGDTTRYIGPSRTKGMGLVFRHAEPQQTQPRHRPEEAGGDARRCCG